MELRLLLAAVALGGMFGSASATVESIESDVMVVEIQVEVVRSADSVVAHLNFDNEPVLTLPLLDRGGGVFGIRTELEPKNYIVVFEAVGEEIESTEPVSLTELGVDLGPAAASATTVPASDELSNESRQMLWLAVALGAASLSALAFWVLGGRDDDSEGSDEPHDAKVGSVVAGEEE